jgi:polyisoprenoid-binding protein YceI
MKRLSSLFVLLALFLSTSAVAQTSFTISPESSIVVEGASNKSDWTVKAESMEGSVEMNEGVPQSASLTIPVAMLKSGRAILMDRLLRGAFKAEENPDISFVMTESSEVEEGTFDISGTLTMAGVTQPVTVRLVRSMTEEGAYLFSGSHELNMRDYEMDPPTAMFGALLTKPDVTILFELVLAE